MKSTILTLTILPLAAYAFGPSGPPGDPSTAMYSIPDVCQRLESGVAGEKRVFRGPSSAPGTKSGCNLNELMDKAPAKVADGVNPNEVPAGKKYWGLTDSWGLQTGTMPVHGAKTYVPQAADQAIAAGYYQAGVVKGDANLKPENIRAGVSIFGVVGTYTPKPQTPTAGSTFRDTLKDGSSGPDMVMIPAGTFRMGDIQGGGESNEQPVHSVSVGQFAMGKFEVTVGEFRKFVNATGYKTDGEKQNSCYVYKDGSWSSQEGANWQNLNFSQNDNHPVTCVSWNDGTAYVEWLTNQTGKQYRLPTEAEWEYAARAGTETKYWWGNEIGTNKGVCNSNCGDSFDYTSPVGSFAANQFGLYDTVGNLWEWTCSEWANPYNGKEAVYLSKNNANNDRRLSLRGGSWNDGAGYVRSATRVRDEPANRGNDVGFRVSRL
ncbi:formylglycine-generating enzyme family protein [Candidatus Marithrix sp. Canyon 246]|uniref:formylglycine-generating enzyme family protein n=1 Tax=Candidatus Marithrix sp. Canyon 246 TaxID=1827136 RepID=UPI00084A25E1|nr:formylglycine-generating enzyme family protein [Candidatus Marithrix sp. Canyon 246]